MPAVRTVTKDKCGLEAGNISSAEETKELLDMAAEHIRKCTRCMRLARKAWREHDTEAKYHLFRRVLGIEKCQQ